MKNAFLYKSISQQSCRQQFPQLLHNKRFVFADEKDSDKKDSAEKGPEAAEKPTAKPVVKEDEQIVSLRTNIGQKAEILANLGSRSHAEELKKKEGDKETAEKLQRTIENLNGIVELEKKSKTRTKKILEEMVQKGQLSDEEARQILNLGPEDSAFQSTWKDIIENPESPATPNDLTTIKQEAYEFEDIEAKMKEANLEHGEIMREALDSLNLEAERQRSIDNMTRQLGFPLKKDQVVRFQSYRSVIKEDGTAYREPVYREITIKDVCFEDVEIDGQTIPSTAPMVALQVRDLWPDENGHESGAVTFMLASDLKQLADSSTMVQPIETRQETDEVDEEVEQLSKILGVEIKEGDEFEYRQLHEKSDGSTLGLNRKVRIINIHKKEDPFLMQENSQQKGQKETFIELDHEVVVADNPTVVKKKSLTIGEFARWYQRIDALKPINFKEAREELAKENRERNRKYERKDRMYPPILLKEGETLYYDTDPPSTFVIKKIDEFKNEIHLDNGSEYTAATFLAWVRRNQVEKMTAEAQAEKAVQHMDDSDPRKSAALEKAKKEAEEAMDKRVTDPPKDLADDNRPPVAPSGSALRQLWNQSNFLSMGDMWEMGKEVVEYVKRYLERYQKGKIGRVGHSLFPGGLGAEFKSLQQQAENEFVQRYMQSYEQYGYGDLYDRLRQTSNKDELKAILQSMAAKGWIIWDDPVLLAAITRIGNKTGDNMAIKVYDEERLKDILDAFWGDSSYVDLKHKNESSFNSLKNSEKESAAAFEADPNGRGLKQRLQELLHAHLQGHWVDRARYEAYLEFAIGGGKLSFADKIYFLIMGVGAEGPPSGDFPGRTLLDVSRIGALAASSGILGKYPIIEFFAAGQAPKSDKDGNVEIGPDGKPVLEKITRNTFKYYIKQYIEKETKKDIYSMRKEDLNPTEGISTLTERVIFSDPAVEERVLKASGDVANWDHDDFHEFAPQLAENQIKQLTFSAGGAQKATPAAIKNAIVGFNHFIGIDLDEYTTAMKNGDVDKANMHLYKAMRRMYSFQRLHGILDRRYELGQADQTRLKEELKAFAGVDKSRLVTTHIQEMNDFMRKLIGEMLAIDRQSFQGIAKDWDLMTTYQRNSNMRGRQSDVATKFSENFNKAMAALMKEVGPQGVYEIIQRVQGSGKNKTIRGIMARSNDKDEAMKVEQQRYKFEEYEGVAAAQETVEKIEQLRFRLKAAGGEISQQQREQAKRGKLNNLINRVKSGDAVFISDMDMAMLEGEVKTLESVVGDDFDDQAT